MRIDKDKLAAIAAMPDDKLWSEVRALAASHGYNLPTAMPSASEMSALRAAIAGGAKINLMQAARVLNQSKKRGNGNE